VSRQLFSTEVGIKFIASQLKSLIHWSQIHFSCWQAQHLPAGF